MSGGKKIGDLTQSYFTLMPAVKFDWFQSKTFGVYSKLGAGATIRSEKGGDENESALHFNWQASLLGLELGSHQIRGFVEVGVGEQGIGLVGLRYKF